MDFQNKSVIVTGASTGLGRGLAAAFAERGACVTVNYASSEEKAKETLRLVEAAGGKGILHRADVSGEAAAEALVAAAEDAFGRVDVLVNNAARTVFLPFDNLDGATEEGWRNVLGTNVMGAFFVARAAAKRMAERGGSIINIASIAAHRPSGSSIPYCVSKAGILMLTKCLAKTLGPKIRVNSVSPGYIAETAWNDSRAKEIVDAGIRSAAEEAAVKRTATPADLVHAVLYLASGDSSFCTGTDLLVDGGRALNV